MIGTFNIQEISFEGDAICLRIDGNYFKIPLENVSEKLRAANDFQRSLFNISPSGYGIHWPLIDEDLSVERLIKIAEKK